MRREDVRKKINIPTRTQQNNRKSRQKITNQKTTLQTDTQNTIPAQHNTAQETPQKNKRNVAGISIHTGGCSIRQ